MALNPIDERHLAQIKAGTIGRKKGHTFEKTLTADLNSLRSFTELLEPLPSGHLFRGSPAKLLMRYIVRCERIQNLSSLQSWWLGGLATSGEGDTLHDDHGNRISGSKSDVVIAIEHSEGSLGVGVSVKTCSKATPTNDQFYFTTASAFCRLLRNNAIPVSETAEHALKMFCGDPKFRPIDNPKTPADRISDPSRWYWEELPAKGRRELEAILSKYQRQVSTVLLQKAYANDPFAPSYLLHQTVKYDDIHDCPIAIFEMDELLDYTCNVGGFHTRAYVIHKGSFKHDPNEHLAPRFGYIQFQRAGNRQHPTQLQFNLQAGYFHKLPIDD